MSKTAVTAQSNNRPSIGHELSLELGEDSAVVGGRRARVMWWRVPITPGLEWPRLLCNSASTPDRFRKAS